MRTPDEVYWLHGDHLGSTSLVTDESDAVEAATRYLPYGEPRSLNGTLPTDYTYTGQRADGTIQLIQMGVRWYSPDLGRWISPDSIVPDPVTPQNYNRFAYVLSNPLRYTDPTGYLSEDQIMDYFDVETWEDVLAFFGAGREFEGRWGWLETLRQAELGDEIAFYDNAQGVWPPLDTPGLRGTLVDREGQLYIQSGDSMTAAGDAAWSGSVYYRDS